MELCSAGAVAAEEAAHGLDPPALKAEALLGGEENEGACSEDSIRMGGTDREQPKSTLHSISFTRSLSFSANVSAARSCPFQ